ncbi:Hypothetical predicted protein [Paramuricea clavata]|uniref:Uncharacterized protein n=1 Tax=Paramuricea clavata TaxID=317549 RepID=A0A6S7IHL4_PARCT|nr:Hypothetical predicted protein [Paramuricea clavata]
MKEEHDIKQFLSECVEDTSKTGKKVKGRKRKGVTKTGSEENIPTLTEDVKSIKKRKRGKSNGNKLCVKLKGGDTVDKHSKKKKNKSVVQDSSEIAPVGNENDVKDKLSKEAEASGNKGVFKKSTLQDTNNTKRKIKDTPRIVSSADSLCQSDLGLAAETIIETPEEATEIAKGDDINLTPDSMPLAVFLRHAQKKVTQERKKNDNYTNRETTIMEHMKPMGPLKMDGNVAENWRKWRQRWNLYAKASGADGKDELRDSKFESYCTPRKNTTYERYIFNTCVQNGRKLNAFILDLRNKAKTVGKGEIPQNLATYWNIRHELSEAEGLIFKDHQLVIPTAMRSNMLNLIHESHLGIEKCKARARAILFWPGMSKDIYEKVSKCATCATYRRRNQKEPMIAHQIPKPTMAKARS